LGSTLKVMSAIEYKKHGYYVHDNQFKGDLSQLFGDDLGQDQRHLEDDDFRYALGAGGSTRKKLARSAHCILEYIGNVAVMVGTRQERERASTYLNWLLGQRSGDSQINVEGREDCLSIPLSEDATGFVMGTKGANLRDIEEKAEVFLFVNGFNLRRAGGLGQGAAGGSKTLLIFSHSAEERERARALVNRLIEGKALAGDDRHGGRDRDRDRGRSRERGGGRSDRRARSSRRRSPSPPRHRKRSGSPPRQRRFVSRSGAALAAAAAASADATEQGEKPQSAEERPQGPGPQPLAARRRSGWPRRRRAHARRCVVVTTVRG